MSPAGKGSEAGSKLLFARGWEEQPPGESAQGHVASFWGDFTVKVEDGAGCTILNLIDTAESFTIKG